MTRRQLDSKLCSRNREELAGLLLCEVGAGKEVVERALWSPSMDRCLAEQALQLGAVGLQLQCLRAVLRIGVQPSTTSVCFFDKHSHQADAQAQQLLNRGQGV